MAQQQPARVEARLAALLNQEFHPGDILRDVRRKQEEAGIRETYTLRHLESLLRYEDTGQSRPPEQQKVHCQSVHGPSCRECTTCHFCRQKILGEKTFCVCGGACGIWCADCLQARMGENINKALRLCRQGQWRCPVCRDICNCSGATCLRASRGWERTGQLIHEAKRLGYLSVAHYLILTALDRHATAAEPAAAAAGAPQYTAAGALAGRRQHRQPLHGINPRRQQRAQAALQDNDRMLEACRAALAPLKESLVLPGHNSVQAGLQMCHDVLDAAADDCDEGDELPGWSGRSSAGLTSPLSSRGGLQAPRTLFPAAGAAATMHGTANRPQPQHRSNPGLPSAAGAAGRSRAGPGQAEPVGAAGSGAEGMAAFTGASGNSTPSPCAAAAPEDMLRALGLQLQPAELGVLGIRGWSPGPSTTLPGASPAAAAGCEAGRQTTDAAAGCEFDPQPTDAAGASGGPAGGSSRQTPGMPQQQQPWQQPQGWGRHVPPPQQHGAAARQPQPRPDLGFGPEDLPGRDAPGYGSSRPAGQWHAQQQWQRQQQQQQQQYAGHTCHRQPAVPGLGRSWYQPLQATRAAPCGPQQSSRRAAHQPQADGDNMLWAAGMGALDGDATAPPSAKRARVQQPSPTALGYPPAAAAGPGHADSAPAFSMGCAPDEDSNTAASLGQPPEKRARSEVAGVGPGAHGEAMTAMPGTCPEHTPAMEQQQQQPQQGKASRQGGQQEQQAPVDLQASHSDAAAALHQLLPEQGYSGLQEAWGLLQVLQRAVASGIGPDGLDYGLLCNSMLMACLDEAFYSNQELPLVVDSWQEADPAGPSSSDSIKAQQACELLLFLAKFLPPDKYDDAVRLLEDEPFMKFRASHPAARAQVLRAAVTLLLEVLPRRAQPHAAVYEAWVASALPQQHNLPPAAVLQLAEAALEGMAHAHAAMEAAAEVVLGWMGVLHDEVVEVQRWLRGPKDLLGPLQVGHIKWHAAHAQCQQAWAASAAQQQAEEADVLQERRVRLEGVVVASEQLLLLLAECVAHNAQHLPRKLAAQLLSAPVAAQLLDLEVQYEVQARRTFLLMVLSLAKAAGPDLQQDQQWRVQDVAAMQQDLPSVHQQQQQQVPSVLNSEQVQEHSLELLQHLADKAVNPAARQQHLFNLCSTALPPLIQRVEHMVACEYMFRTGADNRLLQHCLALGTVKVELLAALYGLRLAAGASSWADTERCMAQPVERLSSFCRLSSFQPHHRRFVLFLAAQTVAAAPSLLSWNLAEPVRQQQQQRSSFGQPDRYRSGQGIYPSWQQHGGSAAAAPAQAGPQAVQPPQQPAAPSGIPAALPLRLWLRALLDTHRPLPLGKCVEHVSRVLASSPATAALFEECGSGAWLQQPGSLRDLLARDEEGVSRAVLIKKVLSALAARQGPLRLGEVLQGLHQDLSTWQQQLQQQSTHLLPLLRWQCKCVPALLAVVELLLQYPGSASALPLPSVLQLLTGWMQDSVRAVCGRPKQRSNDSLGPLSPTGQHLGSSSPEAARQYVQVSALYHLPAFLGLLVHMAGLARSFEGMTCTQWPAHARGTSQTLQQVIAASRASPALPLHLQQQIKAMFCLRDLLGTVLQYMSGQEQPNEQDKLLLECLSGALEQQSGLLPSVAPAGLGYASPGLLHHLLSMHLKAVVGAAVSKSSSLDTHRAVNALHLVRHVLMRRSVLQEHSRLLLLPCLASPLLDVLRAGPGRALMVRLQVYALLQQLLTGVDAAALLPQPGQEAPAAAGPVGFGEGALCKVLPIQPLQLQQVFYKLLTLSLASALALLEAEAPSAARPAAAAGASAVQPQRPLQQQLHAAGAEAGNTLLRFLGRAPALSPQISLHPTDATGAGSAAVADGVRARVEPPPPAVATQDCSWHVIRAALQFAAEAARQHPTALQAVRCSLMPGLHELIRAHPVLWRPLSQQYAALLQVLPAAQQQEWGVPADVQMPPPGAGMSAQAAHPDSQQQLQQQQPLPRPAGVPPVRRPVPAAAAAAAVASCSQACSAAPPARPGMSPPLQGPPKQPGAAGAAALAGGAGSAQPRVHVPAASQLFSEGGGRAASCSVDDPMQLQGTAAAAVAAARASAAAAAACARAPDGTGRAAGTLAASGVAGTGRPRAQGQHSRECQPGPAADDDEADGCCSRGQCPSSQQQKLSLLPDSIQYQQAQSATDSDVAGQDQRQGVDQQRDVQPAAGRTPHQFRQQQQGKQQGHINMSAPSLQQQPQHGQAAVPVLTLQQQQQQQLPVPAQHQRPHSGHPQEQRGGGPSSSRLSSEAADHAAKLSRLLGHIVDCSFRVLPASSGELPAGQAAPHSDSDHHHHQQQQQQQEVCELRVAVDAYGLRHVFRATLQGQHRGHSARELQQRCLLEPHAKVMLTAVRESRSRARVVYSTEYTKVLVDPRAAAAAGCKYSQKDKERWEDCWSQWTKKYAQPPVRAAAAVISSARGSQQLAGLQQQQQQTGGPEHQCGQQLVQHSDHQEHLQVPHAAAAAMDAAAAAPAAAAAAGGGDGGGTPGTQQQAVEDSQATIKYMTLPSTC